MESGMAWHAHASLGTIDFELAFPHTAVCFRSQLTVCVGGVHVGPQKAGYTCMPYL